MLASLVRAKFHPRLFQWHVLFSSAHVGVNMRCPAAAVISALWAAAVAAHPSGIGLHTAATHDWTTVESYCWSLVSPHGPQEPPPPSPQFSSLLIIRLPHSDTKHNIRALDHHAVNWDASCATTEKCLAACEIEGYCLAGLEYGHECWCGNAVRGEVRPVPDSYCDFPCSGDYADTCGGYGFMGLYIRRGFRFIVEPFSVSSKLRSRPASWPGRVMCVGPGPSVARPGISQEIFDVLTWPFLLQVLWRMEVGSRYVQPSRVPNMIGNTKTTCIYCLNIQGANVLGFANTTKPPDLITFALVNIAMASWTLE